MAETTATETKPSKIPIHFELDEKLIDGATISRRPSRAFADCISAGAPDDATGGVRGATAAGADVEAGELSRQRRHRVGHAGRGAVAPSCRCRSR